MVLVPATVVGVGVNSALQCGGVGVNSGYRRVGNSIPLVVPILSGTIRLPGLSSGTLSLIGCESTLSLATLSQSCTCGVGVGVNTAPRQCGGVGVKHRVVESEHFESCPARHERGEELDGVDNKGISLLVGVDVVDGKEVVRERVGS